MDAKDLMVGNWVRTNFERDKKFIEIGVVDFKEDYFHLYEPIPLTEDILVNNCGFTKYTWFDGCFIKTKHGDLMIRFFGDEIYLFFTNVMYDNQGMKYKGKRYVGNTNSTQNIKYLHELQNLFKILTKKELKVKL